jgi:hyperosmotically inducible periplasmic protein
MKQFLVLSLLLCLSLAAGCKNDRNVTTTEAAREPARMTDRDLEDQIEAKLNADPQLRAADLSVDTDVDRNMATLKGNVESEELRSRAMQMARSVQPGLNVENKIEVKRREMSRSEYTPEHARQERETAKGRNETVGSSVDDAWIHAKIVTQLIGDKDVPERKINVDVNNNVVTLRGMVDTIAAKEEAERIAKQTDGVKSVMNQLKVGATR